MKIAFPTDEHFPFQDDRSREVALKIVSDFDPQLLLVGSDGMDFYALSKFDKNPKRLKVSLQDEIRLWQRGQREWAAAATNAKRIFIPGNHEARYRRVLWNTPGIADLEAAQLENVLELSSLGIEWNKAIWENPEIDLGPLVIKHGALVRSKSAYTAQAELESERYATSFMIGHTHRGGMVYASTRRGLVQAIECFCLCKLDPEYVYKPNWQQGIVLAEIRGSTVTIEAIPIHTMSTRKRAAYWRGKEYI